MLLMFGGMIVVMYSFGQTLLFFSNTKEILKNWNKKSMTEEESEEYLEQLGCASLLALLLMLLVKMW